MQSRPAQGPPPASHQPARQLDHTVGRFETRPKIRSVRSLDGRVKFNVTGLNVKPALWPAML